MFKLQNKPIIVPLVKLNIGENGAKHHNSTLNLFNIVLSGLFLLLYYVASIHYHYKSILMFLNFTLITGSCRDLVPALILCKSHPFSPIFQ
jgi:hypothetical protein